MTKMTLFRARVPKRRLERAKKILSKAGLTPEHAFNLLLEELDRRQALPFDVTTNPTLSAEKQAAVWARTFDSY